MKNIAINYNSAQYVYLFRLGLIERLKKEKYNVTIICTKDDYTDELEKLGLKIETIKLNPTGNNFITDLIYLFSLIKILSKNKISLCLNFTIKPNVYGTIASSLLGIKSISTITGLGTSFIKNGVVSIIARFLYKFSLRYSDVVVFQNKDDRELFLSKKICSYENSLLVPGSGINTSIFKTDIKNTSNKLHFMYIGRLIKEKGILEFLGAFRKIVKENKNIQVSIIGESDHRCPLSEAEILEYKKQYGFKFYGNLKDVKKMIEISDCIVLPSYREGTSRVLLEASSLNRPCIASNVPGCNNVVIDGHNGFLCRVKSIESLYNCIQKFINLRDSERTKMGENSRIHVKNNFEEKMVLDSYMSNIDKII